MVPGPVKYAASLLGLCKSETRLPLVEIDENTKKQVTVCLKDLSLGTDTGGSIRQPASFCGVVGIKPTYGLCSRWGIAAFASSLDQAGVFSKNVTDASILLEEIAGHDQRDSTSSNVNIPSFSKNLNSDLNGKIVGIPKEYTIDGIADRSRTWPTLARTLKPEPKYLFIDFALEGDSTINTFI